MSQTSEAIHTKGHRPMPRLTEAGKKDWKIRAHGREEEPNSHKCFKIITSISCISTNKVTPKQNQWKNPSRVLCKVNLPEAELVLLIAICHYQSHSPQMLLHASHQASTHTTKNIWAVILRTVKKINPYRKGNQFSQPQKHGLRCPFPLLSTAVPEGLLDDWG